MRKVFLNQLQLFQFHNLQKFSGQVEHAVTSRSGGLSKAPYESLNLSFSVHDRYENVAGNREIVCRAVGLAPEKLITMNQVHGKNVILIDDNFMSSHELNREIDGADALITKLHGVGLMVKVADCQGILMFDPVKNVVAAVHAGWRGLMQNASGAAIMALKKHFGTDPANLLAGITPSLGPCCAFFSNPEKELTPDFQKFVDEEKRVNLWDYSVEQLVKDGIPRQNIELARICTMCGAGEKFYSFRRDRGIGGRFGALIFLR